MIVFSKGSEKCSKILVTEGVDVTPLGIHIVSFMISTTYQSGFLLWKAGRLTNVDGFAMSCD